MRKTISFLLVLILTFSLLAGCGGDEKKSNNTSTTQQASTADVSYLDANGEAVYRIVRPDGDAIATPIAQYLLKQFKTIDVSMRSVADIEDGTDAYEILIGNTNRQETATAREMLAQKTGGRYDDYIVCTLGKKIVIFSKSETGLNNACDYFVKNYMKKEGIKGGIEYTFAVSGDFDNITINGMSLGAFNFVRPHYNSSYLTEVEMQNTTEAVLNRSGYYLDILHDTKTAPANCEIIVGNADRDGVEPITDPDAYIIKISGTKVYLNGGSAHATAVAVTEFAKLLEKGSITDADSISGNYTDTIANYDNTNYYAKTWGDDFDGTALDTSKWGQVTETDSAPGKNGKLSVRSGDPRDVYVSDGKFTIAAREDENYYYGGMIWTSGKMYYKYGYLEMSALLPHGEGYWVALWTWSNDTQSSDGTGPILSRPEIDIVEMFGNSKYYAANCHAWPTADGEKLGYQHTSLDNTHGNDKKYNIPDEGKVLGDDFHTYGFLWTDTMMGFTCDGDLYFSYDTTTIEQDTEAFNHMMYLRISMANNWESAPYSGVTGDPADWADTNKYIVDWINIYQLKDQKSIMHCGPMSSFYS